MNEQLEGEEPDSRHEYWQGIAALADMGVDKLDIEVSEMDGSRVIHGTINPADVKRTLENPDYQAMMSRAAKLAADPDRYRVD
jgi:hypothetical protein